MNEKSVTLQKISDLNELYSDRQNPTRGPSEKILESMESMLLNYLEKNPQDTEMWLKLTMVEFTPPFEDYERIEKYITAILDYDKNNIQGLLILAYAQYIYRGEITENLFIRLQNVCITTTDQELLSMIYVAIAWYYSWIDKKEYECALLKSIYYCRQHVNNYAILGELYFTLGKETEGKKMIRCALANVRKIYGENYFSSDVTDINEFFDEHYKGIHITPPNLESMRELLDR